MNRTAASTDKRPDWQSDRPEWAVKAEMAALLSDDDDSAYRAWQATQPSSPFESRDTEGSPRESDAEGQARDLRPVSLANFMAQAPVAWRYAVYPLVPLNLVTLLAGHGGAGKSMLMLTWLAHAACGRAWAGFEFEQRACLYVSLEDPGDLVRLRLKRICETFDLDPAQVEHSLAILETAGGDSSLVSEFSDQGVRRLDATRRWFELADAMEGVGWVAIDNASDAFDGNENERRQVRAFLRRLVDLAAEHDAAVTLLAHIDKSAARNGAGGNSYSGSTAWHNSARSRLALTKGEGGTVTLTHEKHNTSTEAAPVTLRWNDHGVLVPAGVDLQAAANVEEQQRDDAHDALRALRSAARHGLDVTTAQGGGSTSWHALSTLPDLPAVFESKPEGKRRLHTALLRLNGGGLIERDRFQASSRNYKERWVLTKAGEVLVGNLRASHPPIPPIELTNEGRSSDTGGSGTDDELTKNPRTHEGLAASAYVAVRDGVL